MRLTNTYINLLLNTLELPLGISFYEIGDQRVFPEYVSGGGYNTNIFLFLIYCPNTHGVPTHKYCIKLSYFRANTGTDKELINLIQSHVDKFVSNLQNYKQPKEFWDGGLLTERIESDEN